MKTYRITAEELKISRQKIIAQETMYLSKPPVAISSEEYNYQLGCLPPNHFTGDSFTCCEFNVGLDDEGVTRMYAFKNAGEKMHYIYKHVRIKDGQITEHTRITDADFDAVEADCEEIADIEARIYGEENRDTLAVCQYALEFVSGDQLNLIGAYKHIQATNCVYYASAAHICYERLEAELGEAYKAIAPLLCYFDEEHYLQERGFVEIKHNVWIDTLNAGSA